MLEGPREPELTEAQQTLVKKRQELARVMERLRISRTAPVRELRKQVAILSRQSQNWSRANAVSVNRTRYCCDHAGKPPGASNSMQVLLLLSIHEGGK